MIYSVLAVYIPYGEPDAPTVVRHILDASASSDDLTLSDDAIRISKAKGWGHPSMTMTLNSDGQGYDATMAKRTHDMWGNPL